MNADRDDMVLDDTMMYVLYERFLQSGGQGRPPTRAELLTDLDAETESARARDEVEEALRSNPGALKELLRVYGEANDIVELTAHFRRAEGRVDVEITERRAVPA